MIKKIKILSVWIDPEKEITSKQPKTLGKTYKVCSVNLKIADDSTEYAGKYIRGSFFEYKDKVDAKKNKTATERAEYFKKENEGKEILVDVEENEYISKKTLQMEKGLQFKTLTKAQKEVAAQFIK